MEWTYVCLPMENWQLPRQICCAIKLNDKVAQLCCVSDVGLMILAMTGSDAREVTGPSLLFCACYLIFPRLTSTDGKGKRKWNFLHLFTAVLKPSAHAMGFEPGIYRTPCPRPPYVTIGSKRWKCWHRGCSYFNSRSCYLWFSREIIPPPLRFSLYAGRYNLPWGGGSARICY